MYRLKLFDSFRFMQSSLAGLVDNLSEINNKEPENKFTDNMRSMISLLSQSIDKISEIDRKILQAALIEKFFNTYQLCNNFNFSLLLRKGVYPYEYMDNWKRFKEESLPDKESHYSELNNEHITYKRSKSMGHI